MAIESDATADSSKLAPLKLILQEKLDTLKQLDN